MSFEIIWKRISDETELNQLNKLADIVETTQQYVSRKKKKDEFPVEWAYKVGREYNILTEWILTGEGPKRLSDLRYHSELELPILNDLDEWLKELVIDEPFRKDWFKGTIEDAFPMFKQWMKRREEKHEEDNISENSKVA